MASATTLVAHPQLEVLGLREAKEGGETGGGEREKEEGAEGKAVDGYPDGGWRAWSVVGGAWCVSFVTWGYVNAFGVYQDFYQLNQLSEKTPSDISWIGSVQLAMVMACALVSGKAFDAGWIKTLLVTGTVLYTASLIGLSFATTYVEIFLAQGIGCGLAAGILFLPAVSCISHFFTSHRATALGVLATGSSVGGVVYPVLLNKLFNGPIGFAWGVRASAGLTLGLLIIACITIDTRLPPRRGGKIVDFEIFKNREYSLFAGGSFLIMLGLYTPFFYLQSYALENGVSPNLAFYALSILNAGSLFGRLIPNYLADTYGPLTVLMPNAFMAGVMIFVWIPTGKTDAGLVVFTIFFGIFSGAYLSMMPACVASITPIEQMNEMGIRLAMTFALVAVAGIVGTPIAGAIITLNGGKYVGAAVSSGVFVIMGSAVLLFTRAVVERRKGTSDLFCSPTRLRNLVRLSLFYHHLDISINHVALPSDADLKASLARGSLLSSDIGTNPEVQFVAYSGTISGSMKFGGVIESLNSQGVTSETTRGLTTPRKGVHQFALIDIVELRRLHALEQKWWDAFLGPMKKNGAATSAAMEEEQRKEVVEPTTF